MQNGYFSEPLNFAEDIPEWEAPIRIEQRPGGLRQAIFGDEGGALVRFRETPTKEFDFKGQDDAEIDLNKVVKIKSVTHCIIKPFFDKFTVWDQPIRPRDKVRYARQFSDWKTGKTEKLGTPLEQWTDYQMSEAELMTFKLLGCEEVHQLAQIPDLQLEALNMPGAFQIRARARVHTQEALKKEGDATLQLKFDEQAKQMQQMRDELQQMHALREIKEKETQARMDRQEERLSKLNPQDSYIAKKRPGRPRKTA